MEYCRTPMTVIYNSSSTLKSLRIEKCEDFVELKLLSRIQKIKIVGREKKSSILTIQTKAGLSPPHLTVCDYSKVYQKILTELESAMIH